MFPFNRSIHKENVCRNIKLCGYERICQRFDQERLLANAWKFRNGGVKLCPGGVWEWIHAVYWQDDLLGMLLAGGRRANPKLPGNIRFTRVRLRPGSCRPAAMRHRSRRSTKKTVRMSS